MLNVIDNIRPRNSIDHIVNQHGLTFIDFLCDSKICILNGRFDSDFDNFTCVSHRGRSVVDYVCVPHDCTDKCEKFEVIPVSDIVIKNQLQSLTGPGSKLPDHNALRFDYKYHSQTQMQNDEVNPQQKSIREKFNPKVFKFNRILDNFLSSDLSKSVFTRLIRQIELCRENQNGIDDLYVS